MAAKNRTMQQKNLIARKRAMKEARERRWDAMCQEYKEEGYNEKYPKFVNNYKHSVSVINERVLLATYTTIDEEENCISFILN